MAVRGVIPQPFTFPLPCACDAPQHPENDVVMAGMEILFSNLTLTLTLSDSTSRCSAHFNVALSQLSFGSLLAFFDRYNEVVVRIPKVLVLHAKGATRP